MNNFLQYASFLFIFFFASIHLSAQTVDFNARLDNNQVTIHWAAATVEVDFYTIERSLDGKNWENTAQIDGYDEGQQQYQSTDINPYEGLSYYRLKVVDFDENEIVSDVVEIVYEVSMEKVYFSQDYELDGFLKRQ